jgi:hypothetical protein
MKNTLSTIFFVISISILVFCIEGSGNNTYKFSNNSEQNKKIYENKSVLLKINSNNEFTKRSECRCDRKKCCSMLEKNFLNVCCCRWINERLLFPSKFSSILNFTVGEDEVRILNYHKNISIL